MQGEWDVEVRYAASVSCTLLYFESVTVFSYVNNNSKKLYYLSSRVYVKSKWQKPVKCLTWFLAKCMCTPLCLHACAITSLLYDSLRPYGLYPLAMGFSEQEYWSRSPFPFLGDLPDPGIEPVSPALRWILYC